MSWFFRICNLSTPFPLHTLTDSKLQLRAMRRGRCSCGRSLLTSWDMGQKPNCRGNSLKSSQAMHLTPPSCLHPLGGAWARLANVLTRPMTPAQHTGFLPTVGMTSEGEAVQGAPTLSAPASRRGRPCSRTGFPRARRRDAAPTGRSHPRRRGCPRPCSRSRRWATRQQRCPSRTPR